MHGFSKLGNVRIHNETSKLICCNVWCCCNHLGTTGNKNVFSRTFTTGSTRKDKHDKLRCSSSEPSPSNTKRTYFTGPALNPMKLLNTKQLSNHHGDYKEQQRQSKPDTAKYLVRADPPEPDPKSFTINIFLNDQHVTQSRNSINICIKDLNLNPENISVGKLTENIQKNYQLINKYCHKDLNNEKCRPLFAKNFEKLWGEVLKNSVVTAENSTILSSKQKQLNEVQPQKGEEMEVDNNEMTSKNILEEPRDVEEFENSGKMNTENILMSSRSEKQFEKSEKLEKEEEYEEEHLKHELEDKTQRIVIKEDNFKQELEAKKQSIMQMKRSNLETSTKKARLEKYEDIEENVLKSNDMTEVKLNEDSLNIKKENENTTERMENNSLTEKKMASGVDFYKTKPFLVEVTPAFSAKEGILNDKLNGNVNHAEEKKQDTVKMKDVNLEKPKDVKEVTLKENPLKNLVYMKKSKRKLNKEKKEANISYKNLEKKNILENKPNKNLKLESKKQEIAKIEGASLANSLNAQTLKTTNKYDSIDKNIEKTKNVSITKRKEDVEEKLKVSVQKKIVSEPVSYPAKSALENYHTTLMHKSKENAFKKVENKRPISKRTRERLQTASKKTQEQIHNVIKLASVPKSENPIAKMVRFCKDLLFPGEDTPPVNIVTVEEDFVDRTLRAKKLSPNNNPCSMQYRNLMPHPTKSDYKINQVTSKRQYHRIGSLLEGLENEKFQRKGAVRDRILPSGETRIFKQPRASYVTQTCTCDSKRTIKHCMGLPQNYNIQDKIRKVTKVSSQGKRPCFIRSTTKLCGHHSEAKMIPYIQRFVNKNVVDVQQIRQYTNTGYGQKKSQAFQQKWGIRERMLPPGDLAALSQGKALYATQTSSSNFERAKNNQKTLQQKCSSQAKLHMPKVSKVSNKRSPLYYKTPSYFVSEGSKIKRQYQYNCQIARICQRNSMNGKAHILLPSTLRLLNKNIVNVHQKRQYTSDDKKSSKDEDPCAKMAEECPKPKATKEFRADEVCKLKLQKCVKPDCKTEFRADEVCESKDDEKSTGICVSASARNKNDGVGDESDAHDEKKVTTHYRCETPEECEKIEKGILGATAKCLANRDPDVPATPQKIPEIEEGHGMGAHTVEPVVPNFDVMDSIGHLVNNDPDDAINHYFGENGYKCTEYFKYYPCSYYDIYRHMAKSRNPQPSSIKKPEKDEDKDSGDKNKHKDKDAGDKNKHKDEDGGDGIKCICK